MVTYLAGNRIRGTNSERVSTATLTLDDNFSSDNATDQHANIGVANNRWEFDFQRSNSNESSALTLSSALSDSKWCMDFDFYLNAVTLGNTAGWFAVSNEDETSSRTGTTKHSVYMAMGGGSSGGTDDNIFLRSTYNSSMSNGDSGTATFSSTTDNADLTTHFCRMLRDGTAIKLIFYTTIDRITASETLETTINSSATGLQYIVLHNFDNFGGHSGILTGYIDNIKIYDTVTSPITYPLNVVDGSIFYETDTNKEYVLYNNTWSEV
jgi:hypothetical protein